MRICCLRILLCFYSAASCAAYADWPGQDTLRREIIPEVAGMSDRDMIDPQDMSRNVSEIESRRTIDNTNDSPTNEYEGATSRSPTCEDTLAQLQRRLAELEVELQGERNKCKHAEQQLSDARLPVHERLPQGSLEPNLPAIIGPNEPGTCTHPATAQSQVSNIMTRETVFHFKGEAPASNPLKKNKEIRVLDKGH